MIFKDKPDLLGLLKSGEKMAELYIHKNNVETVFDLLGDSENDITKSIAWAFVRCPALLSSVIKKMLDIEVDTRKINIQYQVYEEDKGITDLEITDNENFFIIVEAKRGWILNLNVMKVCMEK